MPPGLARDRVTCSRVLRSATSRRLACVRRCPDAHITPVCRMLCSCRNADPGCILEPLQADQPLPAPELLREPPGSAAAKTAHLTRKPPRLLDQRGHADPLEPAG